MGEKESHNAAKEAKREVAAHPERPPSHEEALARYLSGIAYRVAHHREAQHAPRQEENEKES